MKTIGSYAFNDNVNLKKVIMPDSVTVVEERAFFVNPDKVKKILIQSKKLKKVDKQVVFSTKKVTVILPKSKKENYQKFFTKKRQGKNIKFFDI